MAPRVMTIGMALLSIGACGLVDSGDPPSIAGRYDLVAVNGTVLPCCAQVDSTGTRVTFVGGSLTLKEASPEPFAATPAGWMPESCVHGIPNGAHVDTSGVVTLPDGTQYRLPKCTELHHAAYAMVITRRYEDAEGGSQTVSDTSAGTYAWSDGEAGQPTLVSLLNAGMVGGFAISERGVELAVHRANFGRAPALTPSDPEYQFFRPAS